MRRSSFYMLLGFVVAAVASGCGGSGGSAGEDVQATPDQVLVDSLDDLLTEDADSLPELVEDLPADEDWLDPLDTSEDLGADGIGDLTFDTETAQSPFACATGVSFPECAETSTAPEGTDAIAAFSAENAFPLLCGEDEEHLDWDFRPFLESLQDKQVFFMGEVHGTQEIGPASADLFEALVRDKGYNVLVLEMGMDTQGGLMEYLETGDDGPGSQVDDDLWSQYTDNMFRRTLPIRARQLALEGLPVRIVCVDTPQRLSWVNERLEFLAASLPGEGAGGLLLQNLPAPKGFYDYGMYGLDASYVAQCKSYWEQTVTHLETLCEGIDARACKELEMTSYALYIGAVFLSQEFTMAAMGRSSSIDFGQAMEDREVLIKYNFESAFLAETDRAYAHMGAAHCAKTDYNVASYLDQEFEPTLGSVYSVYPAYGEGSAIFYGYASQSVPKEPSVVWEGLKDHPLDRYFLSASLPGQGCMDNPFPFVWMFELSSFYGENWDSFFWFRKVTPDVPNYWMSNSAVSPLLPPTPWH